MAQQEKAQNDKNKKWNVDFYAVVVLLYVEVRLEVAFGILGPVLPLVMIMCREGQYSRLHGTALVLISDSLLD